MMSSSQSNLLSKVALCVVILFVAGCQYVDLSLLNSISTPSPPQGPTPLAILSVAANQTSFDAALKMVGLEDKKSQNKPFEKRFPGIDTSRSAAAFLYLCDDGHADPLVYIPVNDYDRFLNGLGKRFKLNRAIATKMTIGRHQLVMMHVGDYAVFGNTIKSIKCGPDQLQPWLDKFASDSDIAFHWIGAEKKSKLQKLLVSVKHSFGSSAAQVLSKAESVVVDINSDAEKQIQLEAQINVDQNNKDKLETQLSKLVVDTDSITSNPSSVDQPEFYVNLKPEDSQKSFAKIEVALSDFFKSQAAMSKKRKVKRGGSQNQDQALEGFSNLMSGGSSSGAPCPPRTRRSGG